MAQLRILADANIPYVNEAFGTLGTVTRCAGEQIDAEAVREVDVLLVRSVTPVGAELLAQSAVQFVGSATSGVDHIDQSYLAAEGIAFAHASASNADSVADYVLAALLELAVRTHGRLSERTVGVVGCGNVGARVARRLEGIGATVLRNDPPRAEAEAASERAVDFVPLEVLVSEADVITTHVPLTTEGSYPTYHLLDEAVFDRLQPGTWVINTARGPVVDGRALLSALRSGPVAAAVLDVWEGEPEPDPELMRAVDLATPHIAGYAFDGKVRGTAMLYRALCSYLNRAPTWSAAAVLRPSSPNALQCDAPDPRLPRAEWFSHLMRQAYDIWGDDERMRDRLHQSSEGRAASFRALRAEYPRRRECQRHHVRRTAVPSGYQDAVRHGLAMRLHDGLDS